MGLLGGLCGECPARAAPPRPPSPVFPASPTNPGLVVLIGDGLGRRGGWRGASGGASRVRCRGFAYSPSLALRAAQAQVAEVAAVSAHFAAPAGLAATGATVAGVKYMFVRGEENEVIQCKKVSTSAHACTRRRPRLNTESPPPLPAPHSPPARASHVATTPQGAEGVYFYRCNTCIIVAHHDDKVQPGNCLATVAKLGDFLKESGI